MEHSEALQHIRNLFALENNRAALTSAEATAFQAVIDGQDPAAPAALAEIYSGDDAKATLSKHDLKTLLASCEALGVAPAKKKAAAKKK